MTEKLERREVFYSGRVQGVGFRVNARQIAGRFDVTGFVRNLPDRRVSLVAEGLPTELDRFLAAVADSMIDHIRGTQENTYPATGEYASFEITD